MSLPSTIYREGGGALSSDDLPCVLATQITMPPKKTKTSTAVARETTEKSLDERDEAPTAPEEVAADGDAPTQGMHGTVTANSYKGEESAL